MPSVFCLGLRVMLAKALGSPVEVRQLMSVSFSLIYRTYYHLFLYNLPLGMMMVWLLNSQAVLIPVAYQGLSMEGSYQQESS